MQNLFHDGGFSNMGMSLSVLQQYEKGLVHDEKFGQDSDAEDHSFD
jgi:enoyl-[acyl-carrier protein] reductase I